ncbi:MAG: hypothetical protein GXY32_08430 [Ruminococcaceae bacterium]|nr:hypothetical protein [Oscillospiraceae bacterium]
MVVGVAAFLLFMQVDIIETANHSYILLESIFSGKFRSFYGEVAAHQNDFYYLNNAHYNIIVYLLFAVAELPAFIVNNIFGLAPNEVVLSYIGKTVSAVFFIGCLPLITAIARQLNLAKAAAGWAPLMFALWPPAFFSVLVMGQYDSISLFLMLLGLWFWAKGRMIPFALVFGLAIPFKTFAALLMIPLLLLAEKRVLHILKCAVIALWAIVPSSLVFAGHTFAMGDFTRAMTERLFAARLPFAREVPVFALAYGLLCIVCYFWRPAREDLPRRGVWLGLAVFGLLFMFVEWHPQWLLLLAPFVVLTTLMEKQRAPWLFVDIILCAGFFLTCAAAYPGQLEANLFNGGIAGLASGTQWVAGEGHATLMSLYTRVDVVRYLPTALFSIGLGAHLILKLPLRKGTPASRFLASAPSAIPLLERKPALGVWLLFGIGFGLFWFLPTLASWLGIF